MHSAPQTTFARLERVLRQRLIPRVHTRLDAGEVTVSAWTVDGDGEPVPAAHALGLDPLPGRSAPDYRPIAVGDPWGPAWGTTWFRVDGAVPADAPPVTELVVHLGWEEHSVGGQAEGLVHRPNGSAIKALHPRSTWLRLTGPGAARDVLREDGTFTVYIEAAANPLVLGVPPFVTTTLGDRATAGPEPRYRLARVEVCAFDAELWELVQDLEVAGGLAAEVPEDDPRRWTLLRALDAALDAADPQDLAATAPAARAALAAELAKPAHASAHRVTAVGHAHIDSAWLWPVRETVRKVGRTVANVLELMDTDPGFVYAMSSAQQFAWLEEHRPELFARLRERVAEGRFVPVGGMWVESDTNMPGGEAMVRQFTFGKRYFLDRFGVEPEEVWLPDSFGYSGALPQLARLAGFRWFLTQKISWNDTNAFPHHTFWWEGIDGSRIFTHFPPADTYGAEITARELHHAVANFRDKGVSSHSLVPFGYGDGGGGPTREMLARAARFADLEGAPRVSVRTPREFFADAEAELAENGAAVWVGELYLELHRGTFTSQHAMKAGNRRAEALLRTAEYLAAQAAVRAGAPYPAAELAEIWQQVLLHQFHDILPGSSIAWVHREARATYRALEDRLHALTARACQALGGGPGGTLLPVAWAGAAPWEPVPAHAGGEPGERAEPVALRRRDDGAFELDNGLLRAVVDAAGHVTSLLDLATGREIVPAGQALGVLQLHRDEPVRWDAWDIDRDARRLRTDLAEPDALRPTTREDGGAAITVEHTTRAGSRLRLTLDLRPAERRLGMELHADWREREKLLKVALPVAVHATAARYETQFGCVERTIHENTSWDAAHYEVCAHRYVHLAEPGFGVGIVNDAVYGHETTRLGGPGGGTLVRLSLLRAPAFPDPDTDQGEHTLRWAVLAAADLPATVAAGYALGAPAVPDLPARLAPLVWLAETSGLPVIDTVKLADDGSGDLIARVYEAAGGRAAATLRWDDALAGDDAARVEPRETDLLERDLTPDSGIRRALRDDARLELEPFQIVTLRLARRQAPPRGRTS